MPLAKRPASNGILSCAMSWSPRMLRVDVPVPRSRYYTRRTRPARSRAGASADHRVGAFDVAQEARAPGPVVAVRGERTLVRGREPVRDAALDLFERGAAGGFLADGLDHVVDVAAEGAEPVAARRLAVAHDDVGEVELGQAIQRRHPVLGIAVAHEGRPADDGVARDNHLFFREIDEHIALGVGPAEVEQMDLAVAPVELHRP